jgi:hypothetical protein
MKKTLGVVSVVLVLSLVMPAAAVASDENQGQIVFGGDFTLRSGEVLDGDLAVLGGNVVLEDGSLVEGSAFIMGGNADLAGTVRGDVALFGGNLDLMSTALVEGDVTVFGGNLDRQEGATVEGQVLSGESVRVPFDFEFGRTFRLPVEAWRFRVSPLFEVGWFLVRALLLAALAVLVVMFWPVQMSRVGRTVVEQPLITGGLGLLSAIVVPVFLAVLGITLCLLPVTIVGAIALVVAVVFGWLAFGLEIGTRMAEAFHWRIHPAAAAGIGTLVLTIVANGIEFIPCVGWIVPALVGSLALGSVIITRFGTQAYVPSGTPPGASTPPEALPPAA